MSKPRTQPDRKRTVIPLVLVILAMGGATWAVVPLYDVFNRATGFGGTTQVAAQGSDVVTERTVTIRFDASLARGMSWRFEPVETSRVVRIGETVTAFYEAYNPSDRVIAARAKYNVSPFSVGAYFTKIDCFCFGQQVLGPGERERLPVTFYVDPEMVEDAEARRVNTITLSYTFFETELDKQAALGN